MMTDIEYIFLNLEIQLFINYSKCPGFVLISSHQRYDIFNKRVVACF